MKSKASLLIITFLLVATNCYSNETADALASLEKHAAQGDAFSQDILGDMYFDGVLGVLKDPQKAFMWHKKAADQGYENAQYKLGFAYQYGIGVLEDPTKALVWYGKAAKQGSGAAQYKLGSAYFYGKGVPKDLKLAKEFIQKAHNNGYEPATKFWAENELWKY
tara:strand:+ start:2925 stop:3416 length:492 start_codon:yes stop_codon:yes gene_type:complete